MNLDEKAIASINYYHQQAVSLLLYQSVFTGTIGRTFLSLLEALATSDKTAALLRYGEWFSAIANQHTSWQNYLLERILIADNAFSQQSQTLLETNSSGQTDEPVAPHVKKAAAYDFSILQDFYQLSPSQISHWVSDLCDRSLPSIPTAASTLPLSFIDTSDWATTAPPELTRYYREHGVGIFGQFKAFRWQAEPTLGQASGKLVGIATPDPIRLDQLVAYEHPKQQLIHNTQALLRGYTAQNVLLYGSRGAGKSSLVKALLNEYGSQGLRLIEVPKADLHNLPNIVAPLSQTPQKFIIFVDDLSFEDDDEAFKALKVVLEGGVTARPQNVVVYATSNRRHLIREFFDERPRPKDADEIQAWDTVQEKLSFSDRFGLTLTFTPADQPTYLTIVRQLAQQAGLEIKTEHLEWRARQWATRHNGRSGRSARQFVDFLIAEQGNAQTDS